MTATNEAPLPSASAERRLSDEDVAAYDRDGFVRLDGYVDPAIGHAMLDRVVELAHRAARGEDISPAFVLPEQQAGFADQAQTPEEAVSKIFRLARDEVFHSFAVDPRTTAPLTRLLDRDDIDNFLSQFIFKNAGAWGQPWHQDSFYFPFDPPRPVVGVWLAITAATLDNGCLHVVPGSHREPVHEHVPDRRPNANYGYAEIIDHDMHGSVPVTMEPGDVLLFDSHLMHRSTDNHTDAPRAAMVYHYAGAGTLDRTEEQRGYTVNDWIPARRADGALPPVP